MGLLAKESSGVRKERPLIPAGPQRAVCVNVVDLGSHLDQKYDKVKRLVRLTFELADIRDDFEADGETKNLPRLIGRQYNLSLSERATLRQHLQSWRKQQFTKEELDGFDIATLVGVGCLVNVEHYTGNDGKERAGLGGILPLMPGMAKPTPEGDTYFYSIDDHGRTFPESMPDFLKEKVLASNEMNAQPAAQPGAQPAPDVQTVPEVEDLSLDEPPF